MPTITPGSRSVATSRTVETSTLAKPGGASSVAGTFKPGGWGIMSPIRSLILTEKGEFAVILKSGEGLTGRFEFRDGSAAFMDTLRLTSRSGKELLFALSGAKQDANGAITELKMAQITETRVGPLPFTLVRNA